VRTRVKVVKNKVAPPFKQAELDIVFGQGISRLGDLIDHALALGVIQKSGTWFSFGETRLGQGRENARAYLEQNPELAQQIEQQVRAQMTPTAVVASAADELAEAVD
jgi:recombination protein RecA